ncbi:TPA: hypothetical protein CPT92_04795 [Candidatus Gastranaerophilales bacterium HUM_13]|jgi:hypothetical protein|nr:MAG TPA: hypothetical protein CPT92_04795 [Candidatus Gastranaerophilales bacterium HUM_13]
MVTNKTNLALAEEQTQDPQDLMSFKEIGLKHSIEYDYLYKRSIITGEIQPYYRGIWKLSEREVLEFCDNEAQKKLNKIRAKNGDNK